MFEDAQRTMEGCGRLRNQRPEGRPIGRVENLLVGVMNLNEFGYPVGAVYIELGWGWNGVICPLTLLAKL
jgi:hypothetical protein